MFRREALQAAGFRDGYPIIQDLALEIDIVCAGGPLLLAPDVCFSVPPAQAPARPRRTRGAGRGSTASGATSRQAAEQMSALGWRRAARAARWHLTSRAHALTLLPRVLVDRDADAAKMLAHHAFDRDAHLRLRPSGPRERLPGARAGGPAPTDEIEHSLTLWHRHSDRARPW